MLDPIPAQETVSPVTQSFIPPLVSRRGRILAGAAFFIVVAVGTFGVFAMLDDRPKNKDTNVLVQPPPSQSVLPSASVATTTPVPTETTVTVATPAPPVSVGNAPTQVVHHQVLKPPPSAPSVSAAAPAVPVVVPPKIDPGSVR